MKTLNKFKTFIDEILAENSRNYKINILKKYNITHRAGLMPQSNQNAKALSTSGRASNQGGVNINSRFAIHNSLFLIHPFPLGGSTMPLKRHTLTNVKACMCCFRWNWTNPHRK